MKTSEKTDKLFPALFKVKQELKAVVKDANNPHFKSKYATLNNHLDEADAVLEKYGMFLLQPTGISETGAPFVESQIIHAESGQWCSSSIPLVVEKQDMQKYVGAATYGRRASLSALLGMQAEDDDGEAAVGRGNNNKAPERNSTAPMTVQTKAKVESGPTATGAFKKPVAAAKPVEKGPTVAASSAGSFTVETKPALNGKTNPVTSNGW
jgi:ERF superfamily